ncbi:NAD-binding protein [Pseudodesulfovibrio sp. zrk46]|uniref:potassium channel family protein n=1 Tax=Pseudodesulfovibrio sp. zrk46 TaxID=2725288 RepID=UPI001448AC70|nr:NAD-binding protein [Pseudodesulfovibrio sp. zrk46]QJB56038.1 potassium channel protein [Pseudodesulfovibrio sp. zrk46]
MKFIPSQLVYFFQDRRAQRNLNSLIRFILFLCFFIVIYSVLFHVLMEMEGQHFSWITGFYWTLTVMSTLGFGDITFTSDLGKLFSLCVLMSGIVFLLVMLPFTFIQFFYAPFLEAQTKSRAARELPEETSDHLIIIGSDQVALSLASRVRQFNYKYCILVNEVNHALDLVDQGFNAVVGESDNPETFKLLRTDKAAMVVLLSDDMKNTNAAFTIREVAPDVPVVANADSEESVDILELAGSSHVFQFMDMLGEMLARRTLGTGARSNVIGSINKLNIAEAQAVDTLLVGRTVKDSGLRSATGMNIVGLWEQGQLISARPDTVITSKMAMILAGSEEQLKAYDDFVGEAPPMEAPVLILGGGRVGQSAAKVLKQRGIDYKIVEKNPKLIRDDGHYILGSASDIDVLKEAGIDSAPSVFVTTHTDDLNIYLTIYCRRLRPDIQVLSRATFDRNISVLHKAGADLVMSYATLTANTIINLLSPGKVMTLTEGLNIFRVEVGPALAGKTLMESNIRDETGCNIIAVSRGDEMEINPDPTLPLNKGASLLVIGGAEDERRFLDKYQA